jgi:hypothetical protein
MAAEEVFRDGTRDSYGVAKGFCRGGDAAWSLGIAESGLGATVGVAAALVWLVTGREKLLGEKWSMVCKERGPGARSQSKGPIKGVECSSLKE